MTLEPLLIGIYLSLTAAALLSLFVPFLKDLSTHGKTRSISQTPRNAYEALVFGKTATIPKRCFIHFYLVGISVSVIMIGCKGHSSVDVLCGSWMVHLLRRVLECRHVHSWREDSRMHLAGYFLGILHYLCTSCTLVWLERPKINPVVCVVAVGVCCVAQYEQFNHHYILANLRQRRDSPYLVPKGGWFQWISAPHYLAEILIYSSFLCMGPTPAIACLFVWVTTNLTISALRTHHWYVQNITDYPTRMAIVPFLL